MCRRQQHHTLHPEDHPLNFSIVLEDARVESGILAHFGASAIQRALVVASGGCTALALKHANPAMNITAFDTNPAQLQQLEDKIDAIARGDLNTLGVYDGVQTIHSPDALHQRGRCEAMFRLYRHQLTTHVFRADDLAHVFSPRTSARSRRAIIKRWCAHKMWAEIHEEVYGETMFARTFGAQSTQHTAPGSYPAYVQAAFTRGLMHVDACHNPWLQHIYLGHYLRADAHASLLCAQRLSVHTERATLETVSALDQYDFIQLSNIFDWTDDATIQASLTRLARDTKPGAIILLRQLNHTRDLTSRFGPYFSFETGLAQRLQVIDRSMLYNRLVIAQRNERPFEQGVGHAI